MLDRQIHLEFETFINECPNVLNSSLPPLILSNRWYALDDTNWQQLRTRTYQGICTVRGDVLQKQQLPAYPYVDYFRDQFANFKVPVGFQRERVQVTVTPDGNSAHYVVVDVEQLFNKSALGPAVRIEVADTAWTSLSRTNRLIVEGAGLFWDSLDNTIGSPLGWAPKSNDLKRKAAIALSKMYKNVLVRCWGNRPWQTSACRSTAAASTAPHPGSSCAVR